MESARQLSVKDVLERKVWVRFEEIDGSQFCFETTLNLSILRSMGISLEKDAFPRLDKKYLEFNKFVYKSFIPNTNNITFWDRMNYTDKKSKDFHEFL